MESVDNFHYRMDNMRALVDTCQKEIENIVIPLNNSTKEADVRERLNACCRIRERLGVLRNQVVPEAWVCRQCPAKSDAECELCPL